MLATIALLLLASQEPEAPPRGAESETVAEDHDRILAGARAALERARAAQDTATASNEAGLVVELLAPLPLDEGDGTVDLLWEVGVVAYRLGISHVAREAWGRVSDHRERTLPADHPDLIDVRANLAITMKAMGDLARARALEEAVVAALERIRPEDDPDLIAIRSNLVNTMRTMGDLADARALGESLVAALERTLPADHPDLLRARGNLAVTMKVMGDVAGARALREAVLAGYERTLPPDHPDLLRARRNVADSMRSMGDLAGALALLEAVVAGYERSLPADHSDLLRARMYVATTMKEMGDLAGSRVLLEAAVAGYERTLPADHPDLLAARGDLAATMQEMGELAGARALLEAVLEACERTLPPDHHYLLAARSSLAGALKEMGDMAGARALEEEVLATRERTVPEDHPYVLAARLSLATTMKLMGDLAGARALEEAVLATREKTLPEDHPDLLRARTNVASSMYSAGDVAGARALLEAVLAGYERTLPADHYDVHLARVNLAAALSSMGDEVGARALREAAVAGLERVRTSDHPDLLLARFSLAGSLYSAGDLPGARALYEAVVAGYERTMPAENRDLLLARSNLAVTVREMGDLAGARVLGSDLAQRTLRGLELASVLSPREAREATRALRYRHSVVRFLLSDAEDNVTKTIRFDLAETLRATSITSVSATRVDEARRGEVAALRARLSNLVSGGPSESQSSESFAAEVSKLTLERDRLEREIRRELASQGIVAGAIRAEEVADTLGEGEAAVGFVRHVKRVIDPRTSRMRPAGPVLAAHVLMPDGSLTELQLGDADELAELARTWRASLGRPISSRGFARADEREATGSLDETGQLLRESVLDAVLAAVGDATTLHVCLDDFLHAVPIGALPLAAGGDHERVVRDRYTIVNEMSFVRLLSGRRPTRSKPGLLAVGDVAFGSGTANVFPGTVSASAAATRDGGTRSGAVSGFVPLPETRGEVGFAAALFERELAQEPVLLSKGAATKAAFHEHAPGKRFLHVATHGWFAPETIPSTLDAQPEADALWSRLGAKEAVTGLSPMTLCGLAFAGANHGRDSLGRVPGILTAEELAGIDLSSCELAVLSACETNVGIRRAGQGIQSLQTALHAAGARTAITSLWKVDDAATRKLMERFYTYLWVEELGKADALWKAKCDLRAEGHPVRDWAAWVLSGEPD